MAKYLNKNIKFLRTSNNMSQQKLADLIGIDRSTVSRIENNEIETTVDNAINIAQVFKISLSDLINKDLRIPNKCEEEYITPDEMNKVIEIYKKNGICITMEIGTQITKKDFLEIIDKLDEIRNEEDKNN